MARVMVVEDEALLVASYERALRRGRHAVIAMHEGSQAAARALAERPDLILLDVGVPGLDPVAFIRTLKQDPATATIPIIVVSGVALDDRIQAQLQPRWIEDVWLKPIRMERLLQRANALAPGL
jgi:CheY-like chemotaxis protein